MSRVPIRGKLIATLMALAVLGASAGPARAQVVPPDQRGRADAERSGTHDANNMRTIFWNYGMVGDYPPDPGNVKVPLIPLVASTTEGGVNIGPILKPSTD